MNRSRLAAVLSVTTVLFACGEASDGSDSNASAVDAATQIDSGTDAVAANPFDDLPLAPIPDGGLSCPPDDYSDEYGPCCYKVFCYTPTVGAACNLPNQLTFEQVYPYFHGACQCETTGPFSKHGIEDIAEKPGECCYIAGSRRCI